MIDDFNHNKIQRASSNAFETDITSEYVGGNELKVNDALIDYSLPLDDEMPQSVIVYSDDLRIEDKALMLVEKYIYSATGNCLFEVNISSSCKYKIIQKSQELHEIIFTLQEFYALFDELILELIRLLNDSHIRFMQTEDYKQLLEHDIVWCLLDNYSEKFNKK